MENQEKNGLGRREFITAAGAALFAGVLIQITGCSTEEDSPKGQASDATGSIQDNHGHTAVITSAKLTAGGSAALDITGSANHTHTLDLTADEVAMIKAKSKVVKLSSSTGHQHTITFN